MKMTDKAWFWLTPPAIIISANAAYAVQYFSVEEAQKFIFQGATTFEKWEFHLSTEAINKIEALGAGRFESTQLSIWKAKYNNELLGYFIVDEVYGKHELITYALAINPDGSVKQVEILEYRETRGDEIRDLAWRKQFVNKKADNDLKLGKDILNISGATISCKHITEGIKRILILFDQILK